MKKRIVGSLLVGMMALSITACGNAASSSGSSGSDSSSSGTASQSEETSKSSDATYTIAWVDGNLGDESNAVCTKIATEYAESLGVEFLLVDCNAEGEKQISEAENMIAKGVDAIILQPYDTSSTQVAAEACINAGIPVLICKSTILDQSICPYVGQDDTIAGEVEMKYVKELLGDEGGNIVVIEGPTGNSAAINRSDGINEVLKDTDNINILYSQPADWKREDAMTLMETWLQNGKTINAVVSHNDDMALGAYDAILDANMNGQIYVVGIDGVEAALQSVQAGELNATVLQDVDSIAKKAVDVAIKLAKGEECDNYYYVDPVLITSDNVDDYIDYWG